MQSGMDIAKYINNHDTVKSKFRAEMQYHFEGKSWALTLQGATRWTSLYQCLARLCKVKTPLQVVCLRNHKEFLRHIGQDDTQASVARIFNLVKDEGLWERLIGYVAILSFFTMFSPKP
jgi:hypothetical protein